MSAGSPAAVEIFVSFVKNYHDIALSRCYIPARVNYHNDIRFETYGKPNCCGF